MSNAKDHRAAFRLAQDDLDALEAVARQQGLSLSGLVRKLVESELDSDAAHEKPEEKKPVYFSPTRIHHWKDMRPEDVEHVLVDKMNPFFMTAFCCFMGKTRNGVAFRGNGQMLLWDKMGKRFYFFRFPKLLPALREFKQQVHELHELEKILNPLSVSARHAHADWPRLLDVKREVNFPEHKPDSVGAMLGRVLWQEWCYGMLRRYDKETPLSMVTRHEYDLCFDLTGQTVEDNRATWAPENAPA